MSKKNKKTTKATKSNTIVSTNLLEPEKCPYLSFKVKEIGNLPNAAIGQTNYSLNLSSTLEGLQFQAIENKLLYPCYEKVTHKTNWEWHLKLPFLKIFGDFSNLSSEFLVAQLQEEVERSVNPSDSANQVSPKLTQLGSMVICLEDMLLNGGNMTKTQIFYDEEVVVPLKATWTNTPFIKYNLTLENIPIPPDFQDSTALEITFESIINLPIDQNEFDLCLELFLPCTDHDGKTFGNLRFETTAAKSVYKSFSKLARYPDNIKYTKALVNRNSSIQDYYVPPNTLLRENLEDNQKIAQNTCQRFLLPTRILRNICEQEALTMKLTLIPKVLLKTSKKRSFTGKFHLGFFLEKKITNLKMIIPFSEPILDEDGYNACVLIEFNLSSHIFNEPFIDPQIEINATKLANEKRICEQNISKYLKIKCQNFVQNFQRMKLKQLKQQSESLTNLKMFDSSYVYSEKYFLTAAVNYLSVNRANYGNFRDAEVRKKCLIDLCDFTDDVIYKLDERSPLPEPCAKELFELGFIEEANGIHIMVRYHCQHFSSYIMLRKYRKFHTKPYA